MGGFMKEMLKDKKRLFFWLCTAAVFFVFFFISFRTPPSGDDWVYAVGGRYNNPFKAAAHMYMIWSGRFLSELYGYLIAPHKMIWNILNGFLFSGIYAMILMLTARGGSPEPFSCSLLFFLMLSVSNHLRMQTYTWMMGTTYIIPLFLFLLYLLLVKAYLSEDRMSRGRLVTMFLLCCAIPLYMENAAGMLCGANLLIVIWLVFTKSDKKKMMFLLFCTGFIASLVILLSPGAHQRLVGDNAAFNSLSLFEKIRFNWPYFMERTFREQFASKLFFLFCALFTMLHSRSFQGKADGFAAMAFFYACYFFDLDALYLAALPLFVYCLYRCITDRKRFLLYVFLLLCALGANVIMLVSPIFDSRSSVYTVYLFFALTVMVQDDIDIFRRKEDSRLLNIVSLFLTAAWTIGLVVSGMRYYSLYSRVHMITVLRNEQISYYRENPEEEEAWYIAYPDEMIASPNVLEGDETHDYYYREYYGLSHDQKMYFYYLEDYSEAALLKMLRGE